MKWNRKFNFLKSKSLKKNTGNYEIDNNDLPSVTKILSSTASEEKKAKLREWRKKIGEKEATKTLIEANSRGTLMHSIIEHYLIGQERIKFEDENNQALNMAKEIIENGLKGKLSEIWGAEVTLYYPKLYGGTADAIGIYEAQESILDFKQTNKPKKEEYIEDYFLQLGAYALAHNVFFESKITQGVILMCSTNNMFQKFKIEGKKFEDIQKKFLEKVDQYYKQISKKS